VINLFPEGTIVSACIFSVRINSASQCFSDQASSASVSQILAQLFEGSVEIQHFQYVVSNQLVELSSFCGQDLVGTCHT
jgi:hypothetical protein